ncbi:hypothetical protein [Mariprofundus ferrooxydans]|uniref:hypothetical protein n=1 Tax=Mariprofundus ferrooxydans TaxID=314344 RepID=UPI0014311E46|nr:hypothetical protein [Mariprofundus ferrooxydans]
MAYEDFNLDDDDVNPVGLRNADDDYNFEPPSLTTAQRLDNLFLRLCRKLFY